MKRAAAYTAFVALLVGLSCLGVAHAQLIESPPTPLVPSTADAPAQPAAAPAQPVASSLPAATTAAVIAAPSAPVGRVMVARPVAVLQVLDKVSARVTDLRIPVGQSAAFGLIMITVRTCQIAQAADMPEAAAFLQIGEAEQRVLPRSAAPVRMDDISLKTVFSGWMFASSPAVSALEHPTYDVVVKGCAASAAPDALIETRTQPALPALAAPVVTPNPAPEPPPED